MKRGAGFFSLMVCVLALSGCGNSGGMEDGQIITETEIFQSAVEEPTVSINIDDITENDTGEKYGKYCNYLGQVTAADLTEEEGIKSAEATVSYDEETGQYFIELAIKTDGVLSDEQFKLYKTFLQKTYAKVTWVVNGEPLPAS